MQRELQRSTLHNDGRKAVVGIGKQSVGSTSNLFQGYWSHVEFIHKPVSAQAARIYMGVCQEGVLEISREDNEYMGTTFPRVVELLSPTQVGMKFSGQLDELHKKNLRIAVGDGDPTNNAAGSNYIYPGAACAFDDVYGNLLCKRKRCDGFVMEAVLWKTTGSGAVSIGGDAAVIGTPVEFNALDDNQGQFGGTSSAPLGYLYAPDPVGTSANV